MPVLIFVWPKLTDTASHCAFLYWLYKPVEKPVFSKTKILQPLFNCVSDQKLFIMPILVLPLGSYVNSFLSQPNMNHLQGY